MTAAVKQIVCVKWGKAYGSEYVNRLYGMVARHTTPPFRVVCLTDDRQGIDSLLSVESFEYFKGSLGETVTVRVPGGQVGTFVHVLPGAPRFNVGDIVVLFLKANGPAIPIVTGTTQGVFRVKADPRTGDRVVMPPAVHVAATSSRGDPARRPMPIEAFGSAIRGAGAAR